MGDPGATAMFVQATEDAVIGTTASAPADLPGGHASALKKLKSIRRVARMHPSPTRLKIKKTIKRIPHSTRPVNLKERAGYNPKSIKRVRDQAAKNRKAIKKTGSRCSARPRRRRSPMTSTPTDSQSLHRRPKMTIMSFAKYLAHRQK